MKAVFVGGGAHRLVAILRSAMGTPGIFDGGEIYLLDLNVPRAEALGKILMQTPEYRRSRPKVSWGSSLDEALPGADVVGVILRAGSPISYERGDAMASKYGFISSDNVSPNGTFLGIKGAPILLNVARKMEQHCPDAWLLDFANPVAVLSGMVNRHTKIKALGVCAGFTNHLWDLSRILGRDSIDLSFDVNTVGINHLSFIVEGYHGKKELFAELDEALAGDWKLPALSPFWSEGAQANISRSVRNLVRFYRELGVLIFSTEGDGMAHLYYDEVVEERRKKGERTPAESEAKIAADREWIAKNNVWFESHATQTLDDAFWTKQESNSVFAAAPDDIFSRIMRGAAGIEPVKIATSRLNEGAIAGFPDDAVVEYSQILFKNTIRSVGTFEVPRVAHGLISGLAVHQTMVGDACAEGDPKLLAQALLAYPVNSYSSRTKEFYRELIAINRDQIDPALRTADQYI